MTASNGFHRIAVVNRGEAAMRGLRGIADYRRRHGTNFTSIVLLTDPDARSWVATTADEVISLGPAFHPDGQGGRRLAYLDHDLVLAALSRARADAVWVGWGFLAEDAGFAQACADAGITFIGPSADVIRRLGDKIAAKRLAESVGVDVVPWSGGTVSTVEEATAVAEKIGFPLMVKAAGGGGGRGIRKVTRVEDLADAFKSARAEARLAFSDDRVFLEQAITAARHLEVQVIGDAHGTTWAVGVRDCSVQRRNQKVVEETASPALLDPLVEQSLRDAAVRLCAEAGYCGAGTVEFLYDPVRGLTTFMEVNTRLQVEHPVTEMVTGLDLVGLQLHVARGLPLEGSPPASVGHAIEVRLNAEDAARGFCPSPGRIALLRSAGGPGVRVDAGVTEGEGIAPEFDSMIAKVLTWGSTRPEALSRLDRALRETAVVVEGGTTNKTFLLTLLQHPDMVAGGVDTTWLDRLTAADAHLQAPDPLGLIAAAVELADLELARDRADFLRTAARGRPEVAAEAGVALPVRCGGHAYDLVVYRTGPQRYRISHEDGLVDVIVDRLGQFERRLQIDGRDHKVLVDVQGPTVLVEVDAVQHRIERDDGGVVRSPAPAVVILHLVSAGDEVQRGTPLVVIESMKMETTVTAPFAGRIREVLAPVNTQVDAGAPLVLTEPLDHADDEPASRDRMVLSATVGTPPGISARCETVFSSLRAWLLGYDLDPGAVASLADERTMVCAELAHDDPELAHHEEEILAVFTDLGALTRRDADPTDEGVLVASSPKEHLTTYLRYLDRGGDVVPALFLERLRRALAHYDVVGLERSPALEAALHRMYRGLGRHDEVISIIGGIIERRLNHVKEVKGPFDMGLRDLLNRLVDATQGRHQGLSDLAGTLRFRLFDEQVLEEAREAQYVAMDAIFDELAADPGTADREALITRLVACPQPMRRLLLTRYLGGEEHLRRVVLEVRSRRYYRTRHLHSIQTAMVNGHLLATATYDRLGRDVQVVLAYTSREELPGVLASIARHMQDLPADCWLVIDMVITDPGPMVPIEQLSRQMLEVLTATSFPHLVHRFDTTTGYSGLGSAWDNDRTLHVTHRQADDGSWAEDLLYRNLHPMLAKRVGIWRLSNFNIQRLDSVEDVYLFHGIAKDNPADERLFAVAEVRDLTPILKHGRIVALPHLTRMLTQALSAIRVAQSQRPPDDRLLHNRVILYIRPPSTVPEEAWRDLAHTQAPATAGLGIEKVVLVGRILDETSGELIDTVVHMHHVTSHGVVIRLSQPNDRPIRTLSNYERRVLTTRRRGSTYPYEILRMLTPSGNTRSDFPSGEFQELDLDEEGRLVGVNRPWGGNTANIVVALISNRTDKVPEGMRRVVLLGDPSRSLGSLAEAECRRINAAIDLAEQERIPVEWFAVSSGARISMESGTENMDWIGAVLRRIIEFTQGGGEINIVVTGINVGAQPYWNAEATMLMHTRGILVMTPASAMVLTGKEALEFSGGVSAEDNLGIGGFERIMGPNGQGQYWAPDLEQACALLLRHYEHTYVVPGERFPRPARSRDPVDRDVRDHPHTPIGDDSFTTVGQIFSQAHNPERKHPFDMRSVMRAVSDADHEPLERWGAWRHADTAVVWDAHVGGIAVCMIGIESHPVARQGLGPADGAPVWTSGTLFPQSSRKIARALNAATGNRPVVVLANLSGFDGSPESMRRWQLEYGAEIGRAVTNFDGPIVFVVVSRYHGGAFVVFSKQLNESLEIAAVEGSYASVIGGTPAAAVVFARDVASRTQADPRVAQLREALGDADDGTRARLQTQLAEVTGAVHAEKVGEVAEEFDTVHDITRALRVGSVDQIIRAADLRPYVIDAVRRGMARVAPQLGSTSG